MSKREEQIETLKSSIEHWQENVEAAEQGGYVNTGPWECACCAKWNHHNSLCKGCPIAEHTGLPSCGGTPYWRVTRALNNSQGGGDTEVIKQCKRELRFLVDLLARVEGTYDQH